MLKWSAASNGHLSGSSAAKVAKAEKFVVWFEAGCEFKVATVKAGLLFVITEAGMELCAIWELVVPVA